VGRLVRLQRRQRGRLDGIAANAFTTTTLATAVAASVWPLLEWVTRGKPTVLGFCSGAVAGLVVITPGRGFVAPTSAVIIGVLAGAVPSSPAPS
jgi:Amt family ammonium transporter